MSSPSDEQGLDLFEETASAAGSFPRVMRGYDRDAVDAYVREVELKFARVVAEHRDTQSRLADAEAAARPADYSRLGGHARGMLKAAEAQAAEILHNANAQAEELRARAAQESSHTSNETRLALAAAHAASEADLDELRRLLGAQTVAELDAARADAQALLESTQQQRDWMLREAEIQSRAIIDAATADADQRRAAAERAAAEHAAELATAREAALAAIAASRKTASDEIAALIAEANQQVTEQRTRLESDLATADQRREAARKEAEEITSSATAQAKRERSAAKKDAEAMIADANRTAQERTEAMEREIEALTLRRQGILDQFEELSSLAGEGVRQLQPQPVEAPKDK